mmetsp:Transcript_28420/g.45879  ORF Transcript_28420/g.45879 Transcript_28420/m.45879 type:complete len:87 (-) Transcript_28420:195-455(-)
MNSQQLQAQSGDCDWRLTNGFRCGVPTQKGTPHFGDRTSQMAAVCSAAASAIHRGVNMSGNRDFNNLKALGHASLYTRWIASQSCR